MTERDTTGMTELQKLQWRVHDGIIWLTERDPTGAFHLWFTAGLTPLSPLPAHEGSDVREQWIAYYKARVTFERLDTELCRLEARARTDMGPPNWQPQAIVR